jgi:uncharacterized protein (TIGR00255 family)
MIVNMRSMTGYGRGTATDPSTGISVEFELASVNRKSLDAHISGPREWTGFDQVCNEWLRTGVQRGRVNVQLKVESIASAKTGLQWNAADMDASLRRLREYAEQQGHPFEVNSQLLLNLAKSLKDSTQLPDWRELETTLKTAFDAALNDLNSMREREGKALAKDLSARLEELESLRKATAEHAKETVALYREALLQRLKQLNLQLDLEDERLLKELALFADRSDISEELTRLDAHFQQFREFIESSDASGRKMDFLCQEIHREFNTTGSKSSQIEITRTVIEGKNALERIREQVQNVE